MRIIHFTRQEKTRLRCLLFWEVNTYINITKIFNNYLVYVELAILIRKLIRTYCSVNWIYIYFFPYSIISKINSVWLICIVSYMFQIFVFLNIILVKVGLYGVFGITLFWNMWAHFIWLAAVKNNWLIKITMWIIGWLDSAKKHLAFKLWKLIRRTHEIESIIFIFRIIFHIFDCLRIAPIWINICNMTTFSYSRAYSRVIM